MIGAVGPTRRPSRERTPFEGASIVFGLTMAGFGAWGLVESLGAEGGPLWPGVIIATAFVLLGAGRAYLGLRPPR
jgi:hypothetical protein